MSDSGIGTATVYAKPLPPAGFDTTYCQFDSPVALVATGSNLHWYTSAAGGAFTTTAPVPSTAFAGSTIWYVTQSVNGCESDRTPVTVSITTFPLFSIATDRTFACQGDTLVLSYSGPPLVTSITWGWAAGESIVGGTTSSSSVILSFDSSGNQKVMLTVNSPGGRCSNTDTITVKVVPKPYAAAYINSGICLGDTVSLALGAHSDNASQYVWDFDGAVIVAANANSGGPYKIKFNSTGLHTIQVMPITIEGCKGDTTLDTVDVHKLPDPSFQIADGQSSCLEDSVQLQIIHPDDNDHYAWTPAHFFSDNTGPVLWARAELAGYVSVTAIDPYSCRATDSLLFDPASCCSVVFPLAFSPNTDHHNDKFRPIYVGYHRFHNFRIMNRWGQTVFESTNSSMEWDGSFGGIPLDAGTYYYFITYDCGGKTLQTKGDVTLIR